MSRQKNFIKVLALDSLAVLCFVGVILFGWLPGPGGIPLFLAGLALLAANHDWAERWLENARRHSKSFKKILFPDIAWVRHSYDAVSALLFFVASYLFFTTHNRLVAGGSIAIVCFSSFIFLVNRQRLDKILGYVRNKKHKHIK